MYDLLWFLLPVAAFSGWWVATKQQNSRRSSSSLGTDYYQGLNYLLNEQPDKAMDVFVRMMDVSSETVELHLALGSIFRKRGEVDRAIMLHQNLIARPALHNQQRELALLELAQDFLYAGLLDRAERLFLELKQSRAHCEQALKHLIEVYQFEKDWEKAIETARQYERISGRKQAVRIAHFHCELAEQAFAKGDKGQGAKLVKKALAADSGCVRANMIQAADDAKGRRYKQAIGTYLEVPEQDPLFVGEILPSVVQCYEALGNERNIPLMLDEILGRYKPESSALLISRLFARFGARQDAQQVLQRFLNDYPSVQTLASYVNVIEGELHSPHLDNIKNALAQIVSEGASYRCEECGFSGKVLHWQCPSCKTWGAIKPL